MVSTSFFSIHLVFFLFFMCFPGKVHYRMLLTLIRYVSCLVPMFSGHCQHQQDKCSAITIQFLITVYMAKTLSSNLKNNISFTGRAALDSHLNPYCQFLNGASRKERERVIANRKERVTQTTVSNCHYHEHEMRF